MVFLNDIVYTCGNYLLATDDGLIKIDTSGLEKGNVEMSPISSFTFTVDSIEYLEQNISFKHSQKDINFSYSLSHYPSQAKIKYRYRLLPIEENWKTTKTTNLNYVNLQPNDYRFEIYGTNIYGQESLVGAQSFSIKQAWYHTWLFRILTVAFLGYFLYRLVRSRQITQEINLTKEMALKQQMASIKLSALKSQMNPHFIFNALGSIQYYIQKNEQDLADEYLGQFATLMRMYLDASKEDTISLADEIELLQHYIELEQMRFEDLFTYEFEIDNNCNLNTQIPTMLLQPIIENAINHGLRMRIDGNGKLIVNIQIQNKIISATVTDNGIGIDTAEKQRTQNHKSQSSNILNEKIIILKEQGLFQISAKYQNSQSNNKTYPGTQVILTIEAMKQE